MIHKSGKCGIFAGILAVITAVCLALGVYFSLPEATTVYADDDTQTLISYTGCDCNAADTGGGTYYLSENVTATVSDSDGTTDATTSETTETDNEELTKFIVLLAGLLLVGEVIAVIVLLFKRRSNK